MVVGLNMAEYIEREVVEKFIEKGLNNTDKSKAYGFDAIEILSEVHFMPAADVQEVRHGEWDDNIIGFCNVCMECGAIVERTAVKSHTGKLNYCPNCGARMDGDGE